MIIVSDKDGFEQPGPNSVSNLTFHLLEGLNYNVDYTFYVLSFSNAASDPSEIVTCRTGKYYLSILFFQADVC